MSAKKTSWWRRRLRRAGRERGMVEAGIAAAGGLLVVGAVVGNGVAAAAMDMSDGQTWLGGSDGSVVQINPATGQPEYRLVIGGDGETMEVTQNDGLLVVTNLETGVVTSIDLAGLVVGSGRQTDGETIVLIGGGTVMLAETEPGFVQVVDPLTLASQGSPYRAGEDLADVVIDDEGTLWLVTDSGVLRELDWVPESGEFSVSLERPVAGAGPGSRLVPHASGVTVFAPDGGAVLQIGVGADYVQQVPALQGAVAAATTSPADLAPASATDEGLVFMISGRQLLTVDVGVIDCDRPLRPAVLDRRVYVPCGGQGRVIVLDENGATAAPDIVVPGGGDPELIVDDGRLVVHDPQDGRIVVVQQDGSTTVTDLDGAEVPTDEVEATDPLPPVSTGTTAPPSDTGTTPPPVHIDPPITDDPTQDPSGGAGNDDGRSDPTDDRSEDPEGGTGDSDDPDDGVTDGGTDPGDGRTTDGGEADPDLAPSGISATVQPDGSVSLAWTPAVTEPDSYLVTSSDGAVDRSVAADQSSVRLTELTCGTTVRLTVYAVHGEELVGVSTEIDTAACVNPPAPQELTPRSVVAERVDGDVVVGWTAATIAPDRYVVTGMGMSRTVDGGATSVVFADVACGEPIEFTVTAVHTDAGEYSATSARTTETCPVDPADLQPREVTLTRVSGNDYRLSWTAPVVAPQGYTVTGNGVNETLGAGATRLDVTIPCEDTIRLTVTARHADGTTSPVQSNQLTNTCTTTTTPPTLTAPTGVIATYEGGDRVRVSWGASTPAASEYVVFPSSGGSVSAGTSTSAVLSVARGADYTFRVEARWDGQDAMSTPSNTVNVPAPATAPERPGDATAVYTTRSGTTSVTVQVSWDAPADGGSAITGYAVAWSGGSTTVTGTSTPVTINCSGQALCVTGGSVTITIRAVNAIGQSSEATATATIPSNDTIPQNGDNVLTVANNSDTVTNAGSITYVPTSTWANFSGTCSYSVDGGAAQVIPCSQSRTLWSFSQDASYDVSATVTVTASGGGVSASTTESFWAMGRYHCHPEQSGVCHEVAALPIDPDVEVDPLPWTPPEPPNPPVLIAGVGLLFGAGTMRTLRALRRRGLFETPAEAMATTRTERAKDDV